MVGSLFESSPKQADQEVQLVERQSGSHLDDRRFTDGARRLTLGEWQGDEGSCVASGGTGLEAPGVRARRIEFAGDSRDAGHPGGPQAGVGYWHR